VALQATPHRCALVVYPVMTPANNYLIVLMIRNIRRQKASSWDHLCLLRSFFPGHPGSEENLTKHHLSEYYFIRGVRLEGVCSMLCSMGNKLTTEI